MATVGSLTLQHIATARRVSFRGTTRFSAMCGSHHTTPGGHLITTTVQVTFRITTTSAYLAGSSLGPMGRVGRSLHTISFFSLNMSLSSMGSTQTQMARLVFVTARVWRYSRIRARSGRTTRASQLGRERKTAHVCVVGIISIIAAQHQCATWKHAKEPDMSLCAKIGVF